MAKLSIKDVIEVGFPLLGGILGFAAGIQFLKGHQVRGQAILAGWAVLTSLTATIEVVNQVSARRALTRIESGHAPGPPPNGVT